MKQIKAEIVADSVNIQGNRITTYVLTYPRMIHAEVMTHRVFSRNAASSRAIPFEKMLKMVQDDPFIPIAWQKDHKGMQGSDYITGEAEIRGITDEWLKARDSAIFHAKNLCTPANTELNGVTKQLCNRLLEPFLWYTCLVTTTEYDNFFDLRCPKYTFNTYYVDNGELESSRVFRSKKDALKSVIPNDQSLIGWLNASKSGAEIHIQALAEAMWDALNESEPRKLKAGEWHIPFGDQMDLTINSPVVKEAARKIIEPELLPGFDSLPSFSIPTIDYSRLINEIKIKVAIARCARLSYMTFEGEINYQKDIDLFNILFKNKHMSPFEHVARCMSDNEFSQFSKFYPASLSGLKLHPSLEKIEDGVCNNIKGFIQYRFFLEHKDNGI